MKKIYFCFGNFYHLKTVWYSNKSIKHIQWYVFMSKDFSIYKFCKSEERYIKICFLKTKLICRDPTNFSLNRPWRFRQHPVGGQKNEKRQTEDQLHLVPVGYQVGDSGNHQTPKIKWIKILKLNMKALKSNIFKLQALQSK